MAGSAPQPPLLDIPAGAALTIMSGRLPTDHTYASRGPTCPRCNLPAVRVPCRLFDRLVSSITAVHRCRCRDPRCGWEGVLRVPGSTLWTRIHRAIIRDAALPNGSVQAVEDNNAREHAELRLRIAEEALLEEKLRTQIMLATISDAVLTTDIDGNVTYLNLVAKTMTGWSGDTALGRPVTEVFRITDPTTRESAPDPAQCAMKQDRTVPLASDCVLVSRDGDEFAIENSAEPFRNRDGRVTGAVIVFHDVRQSKDMVRKMSYLAQHDSLTGLVNRVLLTERASRAIGLACRHGKRAALLFLDLDGFKSVNDSFGHEIGDQLLKSVALRLASCVRATDTVCRQGGDEFVILLAEIEQPQDAVQVAVNCRAALAEPYFFGTHAMRVTSSIGISLYPDDGITVEAMMQNADAAMYHAKARGRAGHQLFQTEMRSPAQSRQTPEDRLGWTGMRN